MFEEPRIVPHEMVHDDSIPSAEVHELDICKYGDAFDPTAAVRVRQADNWTLDSDGDGHKN